MRTKSDRDLSFIAQHTKGIYEPRPLRKRWVVHPVELIAWGVGAFVLLYFFARPIFAVGTAILESMAR